MGVRTSSNVVENAPPNPAPCYIQQAWGKKGDLEKPSCNLRYYNGKGGLIELGGKGLYIILVPRRLKQEDQEFEVN